MILVGSGETLDFTKEGEYADPEAELYNGLKKIRLRYEEDINIHDTHGSCTPYSML